MLRKLFATVALLVALLVQGVEAQTFPPQTGTQVWGKDSTGAAHVLTTGTGGDTIGDQGSANASHAQSWWVRLSDTTNDLLLLAAPADAQSNAVVSMPAITFNDVYNGTTWDRVREGTQTGSVLVNSTVAADFLATVSEGGTWTVQPGNTANTTPWLFTINQGGNSATVTATNALKVDGSAVTQPVSGTITANEGGAWTFNPASLPTGTAVASGTYTTTQTGADATNAGYSGVVVFLNISAYTDSTITPEVDYKDPVSGSYIQWTKGVPQTAIGITYITAKSLPATWRVKVVVSGATSGATWSAGYSYIH